MKLNDRRILVTGGTSGIGLALARRLAANNSVVVGGRGSAISAAHDASAGLDTVRLDITDEASVRSALAAVVDRLGGLDIVVNSAGIMRPVPLTAAEAETAIEAEVAVNVVGSMRMARLALPYLRRSADPALVFFSSALALTAAPGLASYAATKAAVHSFVRSLRAELHGAVRVFDVLPPFVDTPLAAGVAGGKLSPERVANDVLEAMRRDRLEIPIGRVGALAPVAHVWPAAADRIMARELGRLAPGFGSQVI